MFTVEGVPTDETSSDGKKKRRVFRKIPPNIIKDAKGLIIFTAMRSGFAPFSGAGEQSLRNKLYLYLANLQLSAGGGGVIVVRMSDGGELVTP